MRRFGVHIVLSLFAAIVVSVLLCTSAYSMHSALGRHESAAAKRRLDRFRRIRTAHAPQLCNWSLNRTLTCSCAVDQWCLYLQTARSRWLTRYERPHKNTSNKFEMKGGNLWNFRTRAHWWEQTECSRCKRTHCTTGSRFSHRRSYFKHCCMTKYSKNVVWNCSPIFETRISCSTLHVRTYCNLTSATKGYDTIRDAILTCARKPTWVRLIYRTEPTTKKWKTEKLKSKNGYAQK